MKKIILFTFLIFMTFSPTASAAIGNQGLIINGGVEEIIIAKGEKIRLTVRDRGTNLPVFKDISFFSENNLIASIDENSGILRGNSMGKTRIVIMRSNGNGCNISVRVTGSKKLSPFTFLFIMAIGGCIFLWLRKQYF